MGKSLHPVTIDHIKGTGAFASKQGTTQKTFREEYILPYSLIGYYGVVNENLAEKTDLSEEDVTVLKDAIWNGTKGLTSRSKFGQMPRFLMVINYIKPNIFIGELDNLVKLTSELRGESIRKPEDYVIDISMLMDKVNRYSDRIENIEFAVDSRMRFVCNGEKVALSSIDKFEEIEL